jgi:DNA (cytosine-5)-methyltransferase 1
MWNCERDRVIVDLFAGPGGWDQGLRQIGRADVVGIEIEPNACATAEAAGHERLCADVRDVSPLAYAGADGVIGSPPCQPFSDNGKRRKLEDPRGPLIHEPMRWVRALRPEWVALEQVPAALPIWREFAVELRSLGYSAFAAVLDAADYGVPQNRRRAVLVAKRTGGYADLPQPTHSRARHVSVGAALEWDDPSRWIVNTGLDWKKGQPRESAQTFPGTAPAKTITTRTVGQWRIYPPDRPYRGISEAEAAVLQTFPADYPWQGKTQLDRARQIGDAVPPTLAAHILAALGVGRLECAA